MLSRIRQSLTQVMQELQMGARQWVFQVVPLLVRLRTPSQNNLELARLAMAKEDWKTARLRLKLSLLFDAKNAPAWAELAYYEHLRLNAPASARAAEKAKSLGTDAEMVTETLAKIQPAQGQLAL